MIYFLPLVAVSYATGLLAEILCLSVSTAEIVLRAAVGLVVVAVAGVATWGRPRTGRTPVVTTSDAEVDFAWRAPPRGCADDLGRAVVTEIDEILSRPRPDLDESR